MRMLKSWSLLVAKTGQNCIEASFLFTEKMWLVLFCQAMRKPSMPLCGKLQYQVTSFCPLDISKSRSSPPKPCRSTSRLSRNTRKKQKSESFTLWLSSSSTAAAFMTIIKTSDHWILILDPDPGPSSPDLRFQSSNSTPAWSAAIGKVGALRFILGL